MKTVSYKKLFEYAVKEYNIGWCKCYKLFINSGILDYNKTSYPFYLDDLENDMENGSTFFSEDTKLAYNIIISFMLEVACCNEIKIKHY